MISWLQGIEFARPEWLKALWLLSLLLILYVVRRRAVRLLVPHLPLWEKVLARMRRKSHWTRTVLSLLLQMAIFACAILLAAGPQVRTHEAERSHTIIIVDASLGMRARSSDGRVLHEAAVERARQIAAKVVADGTVALAFLSDGLEVRAGPGGDPADLEAAFEDPRAPFGRRAYDEVIAAARLGGEGTRVVFVTAFAPPEGVSDELAESGVAILRGGEAAPNAGIVAVARDAGGALRIRVQGGGGPRELILRRGESVLASAHIVPETTGSESVLAIPVDAGSRPELALLPSDAFEDDDVVPLVLPEREQLRVLVVASAPTPFLDAFLEASEVIDIERSGRTGVADFRSLVADHDVVILAGVEIGLPLPAGRYLLLASRAPDLSIAATSDSLVPSEPTRVRREDPLVRALDLASWKIDRVAPRSVHASAEVVVDGSVGPLLARGSAGSVRFIDIAVSSDPADSTLPLMDAFPLILEAALIELAGPLEVAAPPVLAAGGILDLLPREEPVLMTASGMELRLPPTPEGTGYRLPDHVGRFRVGREREGRTVALAVLDHPGRPGPPLSVERPIAPPQSAERRVSASLPLLAALLVLLLLEWLMYHLMVTD